MDDLVKKLLEEIDKPAFVKNRSGIYIACNQAFEKFLGRKKNFILGHTAFDISPVMLAEVYTEADKELFAKGATQVYRAPVISSKGQNIITFSKTIYLDEDGSVSGFVGVIKSQSSPPLGGKADYLTGREFEVLYMANEGLGVKEIARNLGISSYTVADYFKSVYIKLQVNNRISAIIAAHKLGII